MRQCKGHRILVMAILLAAALSSQAAVRTDQRPYLCEIGVQAGCGYYAGDANPHIFTNVREVYGAHFRYKFDPRWALQVKGLQHTIKGKYEFKNGAKGNWKDQMINVDVMAEFNFFRLGLKQYDKRVKTFSPYIFAGVGASLYGNNFNKVACYIPLGIGFKWNFAPQWGLNLAWQHNIYTVDDLENVDDYGNTWKMNGTNWLNCDVTGQLTLGIVFAFGRHKKVCRHCEQY